MKTRFTFFSVLAVLFTAALAPVGTAKAVTIIKGPYLQQVTQSSIVIMWETDSTADGSVVYWPEGSPENTVTVTGPSGVKIHEVQLGGEGEGLASGSYGYTVTSGETTSPASTFTTAPETGQSFSFVAYGDSRTDYETHAAVVAAIRNSDPDIVIHTGDIVYDGSYSQWGPQFFTPAHSLMTNTPMFPVMGNHEGDGTWFRKFFSLPSDNEQWYAFTYGCVQFIALDTTVGYSPKSSQYSWLVSELESSASTWLIVYFHHPPYTRTSGHDDTPAVKRHLVPLFEQYDVDMVFSGHSHAYEHYLNNGVHYIVTGGGGAPPHSLLDDKKKPIRQEGAEAYHHCDIWVDVPGESLTMSARYNSGELIEEIMINKNGEPTLDMHVHDIKMSSKVAGPNRSGIATIWIKDMSDTNNVEGATVSGTWSGLVGGDASGRTGVDGKVTLQSSKIKSAGTFTFTVTGVTKSGWTYDDPAIKPSGSTTVP